MCQNLEIDFDTFFFYFCEFFSFPVNLTAEVGICDRRDGDFCIIMGVSLVLYVQDELDCGCSFFLFVSCNLLIINVYM